VSAELVRALVRAASALAATFWVFGMLTLGAIVAPVIFGAIGTQDAASAMVVVFRRFDRIILGCAAVVLACEATSAYLTRPLARLDQIRAAVAVVMAALGGWQALRLSPGIASLHEQGAIRGLGPLGLQLEALHSQATTLATVQLILGIVYVALLFAAGVRPARTSAGTAVALGGPNRDRETGHGSPPKADETTVGGGETDKG
jgi:hypothetical protein